MNTRASPVASVSEPAELPLMDLEFISRHQIVEKYLAGKLPPKGVQDFERFCSRHPELLDAVGLSNHVNAALRLLEASGKPEPWSKPAPRFYERPLHFALLSTVAAFLLGAAVYFAAGATTLRAQAAALQKQVTEQPLLPATITRPLVLQPNRTALALHFLNIQGYEVYCPRLREPRVLRGRRVEVLLPLFPATPSCGS